MYCQCDLIKFHSHVHYEQFEIPLNDQNKVNRWNSTKFTKNIMKMRKAFNEFLNKQFYILFPFIKEIPITYCKYHNIKYIHYNRYVLSRQKWLENMCYTKHDFTRYTTICTPKVYNEEYFKMYWWANKTCSRVCFCSDNYCFFKPWVTDILL